MAQVFGRYVVFDSDGEYNCQICDRWFSSKSAVLAHCRNTGNHEWCERCERVFKTRQAKLDHLRVSSSHNICTFCDLRPDFPDYDDLREHYCHAHYMCRLCNSIQHTKFDLAQHIICAHFGCDICLRSFKSEDNLQHHMKVHEEKNLECPICDKRFSRQSYVLLHLERSSCASVRKVKRLAFRFDDRGPFDFLTRNRSFYCEHCHGTFRYLSSLYQHVEDSTDCSHLLGQYGSDLDNLAEYISSHV